MTLFRWLWGYKEMDYGQIEGAPDDWGLSRYRRYFRPWRWVKGLMYWRLWKSPLWYYEPPDSRYTGLRCLVPRRRFRPWRWVRRWLTLPADTTGAGR